MSEAFLVCLSLYYFCNLYDLDVFCLFVCVSCVSFLSAPSLISVLLNCIPFSTDIVDLLLCLFSCTALIAA